VSKFYGVELRQEDVIVGFHSLDWGLKDKNPLDYVRFFNNDNNLGMNESSYLF
jgi:hypothetical protein